MTIAVKRALCITIMLMGLGMMTHAQTTVTLQPDATVGKDALLHGLTSQASTNFGSHVEFCASSWTFTGVPGILRSIVEFDLSFIPPASQVLGAYLSLCATDATGLGQHSTIDGSNASWIERITSSWTENLVTWNSQPTTTIANRVSLPQSLTTSQDYLNIDVTGLVQDMVNNPLQSFGFMIKLQTESGLRRLNFCSSDNANAAKRPKLVVTYQGGTSQGDTCSTFSIQSHQICKGDSILIHGVYRKASGCYTDTLTNSMNRDSILASILVVHESVVSTNSASLCEGDSIWLAGGWQKSTGFYEDHHTSSTGCDSTVYTLLKVTGIDNTITQCGPTLIANEKSATYQWVDCNNGFSQIAGATQQSFTPPGAGSYAVMVIKAGCISISSCVTLNSIRSVQGGEGIGFRVIPNPSIGNVAVVFDQMVADALISIITPQGQEVYRQPVQSEAVASFKLAGLPKGLYFIIVAADGKTGSTRLILQ